MKIQIELDGKIRIVSLDQDEGKLRCAIDGRTLDAGAVEVAPGMYSILIDRRSLEARVELASRGLRIDVDGQEYAVVIRDPRMWERERGGASESAGRQQIVAPMPGKIIRVLLKPGDAIEAGRGIVVVEAMKMQNEVRSPKTGTLERILVTEGQAVNAGDVLGIVV
jgi:biotin carboxyl carrier protein